MPKIDVTIISGRTAEQGAGLEEGKTSERYAKSTSLIELSPPDADALGIEEGGTVKVTTPHGAVVVYTKRSEGLEEGLAFFPYGPWANQLFGAATSGTGMPLYKGVEAEIEPSGEDVPSLRDIIDGFRSGS
jgi:formylmethanofuran dehydrogenase subunit D